MLSFDFNGLTKSNFIFTQIILERTTEIVPLIVYWSTCLSSVIFPYNFIQSTFNSYQQKCELLIPNWLFEEKCRKLIYIRITFCQLNEHYALKFIKKKLEGFIKKVLLCYNLENKECKITI